MVPFSRCFFEVHLIIKSSMRAHRLAKNMSKAFWEYKAKAAEMLTDCVLEGLRNPTELSDLCKHSRDGILANFLGSRFKQAWSNSQTTDFPVDEASVRVIIYVLLEEQVTSFTSAIERLRGCVVFRLARLTDSEWH
jgi:hypothetical protein